MSNTTHKITPQSQALAIAADMALDYAADRHPDVKDELSVASIEVDGQYAIVKIWVSNVGHPAFTFDVSDPENVIDA